MVTRLFASRKIFVFLFSISATALLGACGGGGGPGYPDLSYIGVDTEAVIDQTNADDFPFVMLEGSSGPGDIVDNLPLGVSTDVAATGGIPDPENMKKAADMIVDLIKSQLTSRAQVTGVSQTIRGNCSGGGGEVSITGDDTGISFNATMQFDNFCITPDSGYTSVTMHGLMSVTASYYIVGDKVYLTDMMMSIRYLKMVLKNGDPSITEEMAGNINMTGLDPTSPDPMTIDASVNFIYAGEIFRIANMAVVEDTLTSTYDISGTLYHPLHGFVDISTNIAFTYTAAEQYCGGELLIEGSDGIVDPVTDTMGTVTIKFTSTDTSCIYYDICVTVNSDLPICAYGVPWGTEPWPAPAVPALPTTP